MQLKNKRMVPVVESWSPSTFASFIYIDRTTNPFGRPYSEVIPDMIEDMGIQARVESCVMYETLEGANP